VVGRLLWFAGELLLIIADFLRTCAFRPGRDARRNRAAWLQRSTQRTLRILNVKYAAEGPVPDSGLLVCNHLGYTDVLVLSALTPAVFVSRWDVKYWPLFGWFAVLAGTIFVKRERRVHVRKVGEKMRRALEDGATVVLFPEGTSSDGATILPFRTPLFASAIEASCPVWAGLIRYRAGGRDVTRDVAYHGDTTFVPHLWGLLNLPGFEASVRFQPAWPGPADRKAMARRLHAQLLAMHEAATGARALPSVGP